MSAGTRFDTVPAPARAFHGEPAGLVTRVIASTIDLLVVAGLLIGAYLAVAGFLFLRRGASFTFPTVTYAQAYWAGVALLVAYLGWSWTTTGRTVGDRTMGVRVARRGADTQLGGFRSVLRAILCAAFPFLLLWVAVDRHRRSVQDLLVGSEVVYDWGGTRVRASADAAGVAVDVGAAVADEPHDGDAEPLPRVDGE